MASGLTVVDSTGGHSPGAVFGSSSGQTLAENSLVRTRKV